MQIFLLNLCPRKAAQDMADQHVQSSCKEVLQILSTVWGIHDYEKYEKYVLEEKLIKRWKVGTHPSIRFAGASKENYWYVVTFLIACLEEFEFRRKKQHAYHRFIDILVNQLGEPRGLLDIEFVPMSQTYQAIKNLNLKHDNPVIAYRRYYLDEKSSFVRWRWGREMPEWYKLKNEYYGFAWVK